MSRARGMAGAALQAGPAPGKGAHRVRRVKAVGAQGPPSLGAGVASPLCAQEAGGALADLGTDWTDGLAPEELRTPQAAGNAGLAATRPRGGGAFPPPPDASSAAPLPVLPAARAEVNTATSSACACACAFRSALPAAEDVRRSAPLGATSMSRFPTVAGRAPGRQEEGERPRGPREERPSAAPIADRGAVPGTLPRPAGLTPGGFGGHGSLPGAGREEWAAGRSLPLALPARSELCVQWEHFGQEGGGPRPKLSETTLGPKK